MRRVQFQDESLMEAEANMEEVFPVLAGIVVGLATERVRMVRLRVFLLLIFGLGFGVAASWISGELARSWVYVLIDIAQVIAAGAMTIVGIIVWRRRLASRTVGS